MLARKSMHAAECFAGGFIGTDFGIHEDLSRKLPEQWREFNKQFIPIYLAQNPKKTKIGAGLACGALWTVSKGIKTGDIVLCPDGEGHYRVGEVMGDYLYAPGGILPHRRNVRWSGQSIARSHMSVALRNSAGAIGTVSTITVHHDEIEKLLVGVATPTLVSNDVTIEDPVAFALEKHLEDFLVQNWTQTELGKQY